MNLIEGTIDGAGMRVLLAEGQSAGIGSAAALAGRPVVFGVRPENVRLDPQAGFPFVVSLVEPTGSENHLVAYAGQIEVMAVLGGGYESMRAKGFGWRSTERKLTSSIVNPVSARPPADNRIRALRSPLKAAVKRIFMWAIE